MNNLQRSEVILPPPLHNNNVSLLSQLSNESLDDLYITPTTLQIETRDSIKNRLKSEFNFEETRIDAALALTEGLGLSKQYEISKLFLNQVKSEQQQCLRDHLQS